MKDGHDAHFPNLVDHYQGANSAVTKDERDGPAQEYSENRQDGLDEPTGPVNVSGPPADCKHGAGAFGHRGGKAQVVSLSSVTRKNGPDLQFLGQSAHAVPCVVAAPRPPLGAHTLTAPASSSCQCAADPANL